MRLYPALPYLPRAVTKSCKLPTTDVFLEKHTTIWVPLLALHLDEEHFPNPLVFDPDRFTEENKARIPPYSYMPFGDGPRHCIGKHNLLTKYTVKFKAGIFHPPYSVFARSPLPQSPFFRSLRSTICNLGHPHPMRTLWITNGGPERAKKRSLGEREERDRANTEKR